MNDRATQSVAATPYRHIGRIFFQRVAELGERPFIRLQKSTGPVDISWREFGAMARNILLGLYGLGLMPGDARCNYR